MIEINNISFSYNNNSQEVIKDLSLKVADGEFLSVIGHSGCGKSTLLRLIAGLDMPQKGSIVIDGRQVTAPSADRTIVFQQYSLFPWLKVLDNVKFALKKSGRFSKSEIHDRAVYFLEKTGMAQDMNKYPYQLSGGMRQRTAIARALAIDSPFLLLDEPFGALDTKIRGELQELLKELWQKGDRRMTVVFVTHDLEEALIMGNRIVFMKDGAIIREKTIDQSINCCCSKGLGQEDCMALKEELAGWYL